MGEAVYYLIAEFYSKKRADIALKVFNIICKKLSKFMDVRERLGTKPTPIEIYNKLKREFPLIFKYLDVEKPDDTTSSVNYLIGFCDMTSYYNLELYTDKTSHRYRLILIDEVWHFADWNPLVNLAFKLGATHAVYYSDEYISEMIDDIEIAKPGYSSNLKPLPIEDILNDLTLEMI